MITTREGDPKQRGESVWAIGITGSNGKPQYMPFRAKVSNPNDCFAKECFTLYANAKKTANKMNTEKGYAQLT
ncbi:hypothetical protein EFA69_16065 [Rufibacter immobilis]|uniref:Uncharacterized protein n=1 Tax=Rufibacter immobilis TaxID=1348778 RepID=A0A3M9MQ23_9BACT|nr:hypothetical protein [Rufibacter immobilis]RNI27632.1 hypothetical protein EFA69_16065 [Rufibacter immobilis]